MTTSLSLWPPSFDAAIFDFDGTIADTAYIWKKVDQAFLGARDIEYTDEYAHALSVLGFDRGARYTIDLYGLNEREEDIVEEWTRLSWALYRSDVVLRPGARHYILSLRQRGILCALATSNEPALINGMRHVDTDKLFDTCVFGCEVNVPKDRPDIYLEAARRLGVDPDRCIVFEDILPGIMAAHEGGFATCAVRDENSSQDWKALTREADLTLTTWEHLAS